MIEIYDIYGNMVLKKQVTVVATRTKSDDKQTIGVFQTRQINQMNL